MPDHEPKKFNYYSIFQGNQKAGEEIIKDLRSKFKRNFLANEPLNSYTKDCYNEVIDYLENKIKKENP